jgi:hypothetical protein
MNRKDRSVMFVAAVAPADGMLRSDKLSDGQIFKDIDLPSFTLQINRALTVSSDCDQQVQGNIVIVTVLRRDKDEHAIMV